jgi:transposase InsO family protein
LRNPHFQPITIRLKAPGGRIAVGEASRFAPSKATKRAFAYFTIFHHSNRDMKYACAAHQKLLKAQGVNGGMSRKGDCYDNAAMEAFFSTLRVECD